ncbi:ABC transporter substrate-binding protein [Streptomyces sp. AC495_CC817]|uniref:ABC transporter substrate-binding protein n=1 Tax=Streptomyces sp. AC495_CC817 TaxID=2823900 RepID=UPI001C280B9B|nr:ABC transporter substrate-binding protein [Streptomyces sp. AC495_CC817]
MTPSRLRTLRALAAAAGAALLLTSCSAAQAGDTASENTITVDTDFGEVTIPAEPQSALGFYTTDVDMLITLGYPLAAEQPIRDDWDAFPSFFPQEELKGVKGFHNYPEFNLEHILEVGPDFILNGLGYETDLHDKLTPIAPTYTYNGFDGGDWRDKFREIAKDLGREEQAQAWFDDYDARAAEIKEELAAKGDSPVVADISFWDGQVQIGCYSISCLVFADLGLEISPLADGDGDGTPDNTGRTLSMEQLGDLSGIDLILTGVAEDGTGLITDEEALKANPLWTALPFVVNGQVFPYNYEMTYGSPSGQDGLLDVARKALLG